MRRALKALALTALVLFLVPLGRDGLRLNSAEQVSLPYQFSLLRWEASNLLSKWTHLVYSSLPRSSRHGESGMAIVEEYFRLGERTGAKAAEVEKASALADGAGARQVELLEAELRRLAASRKRLRNDVEEVLEATISGVLAEADLASWGPFVFPPVDIRLDRPPRVLITSRRDRIERSHEARLDPAITVEQSAAVERALAEEWDLSGLVAGVDGIATYPAFVADRLSLPDTLRAASHEWLHHYLVATFSALGTRTFKTPDLQSLNETFAEMAGREIGDRAYEVLTGTRIPEPLPPSGSSPGPPEVVQEEGFDFVRDMRETRLLVDELLAEGEIEQAEQYMEQRRNYFVENGVFIRKINQAYFAFTGTYAEAPGAISPIGDEMREFRALLPDLKAFVTAMSKVSSYKDFLDRLERLRAGLAP